MLKFLKSALLIIGAIAVLSGGALILWFYRLSSESLNTIVSAALACKSNQDIHYFDATTTGVLIAAAVALVGGIILGIGIGMPKRTFKAKLEAQQASDAEAAQTAADKAAAKARPHSTAPFASQSPLQAPPDGPNS